MEKMSYVLHICENLHDARSLNSSWTGLDWPKDMQTKVTDRFQAFKLSILSNTNLIFSS